MEFSLNTKTGNIMVNDKNILYFEKVKEEIRPYIKKRGKKEYLTTEESKKFARIGKEFIQRYNSDFGKEINEYCLRKG